MVTEATSERPQAIRSDDAAFAPSRRGLLVLRPPADARPGDVHAAGVRSGPREPEPGDAGRSRARGRGRARDRTGARLPAWKAAGSPGLHGRGRAFTSSRSARHRGEVARL